MPRTRRRSACPSTSSTIRDVKPSGGEALVAQLGGGRVGLAELEAHPGQDLLGLGELDLVVLDNLDAVAVGVEKVEAAAGQDLGARGDQCPARRLLVVDDKPEVARRVGRAGAAFHQRKELIADVDKG